MSEVQQTRSVEMGKEDVLVWIEDYFGGGKTHPGLTPRQVPAAWVNGLRAAGIGAKVAKVNRNGNWATLPLVVGFPCPRDHVDESHERFAKVQLLVDPASGWVSIHEDSCSRCTQAQIEEWLITCPRCLSNDDGHPEHGVFDADGDDESPLNHVLEAMHQALGAKTSDPEPERTEWTRAAAVEWLDTLITDDGTAVVPPTMGQAAAWGALRTIPGHPSQGLVREAQAIRKARATQPP